tara:strand:- start:114 stop:1067 length:954 start_codon:yes stop_codon:yes gene_type:complete
MWGDITDDFNKMTPLDVEHVAGIYEDLVGASFVLPTEAAMTKAAKDTIMRLENKSGGVQSDVWSGYVSKNINTATRAITNEILTGYSAEETLTNQQMVRNIRGTYNRKTKQYMGGTLNGIVKAQAETLVRTGASHFTNTARDAMYKKNTKHLESRILYAVMDNRVSSICRDRHLKEWDITDKKYPRLPFHFNERSVYLVRVKGFDPFTGTRPSIGGKAGADDDAFKKRKKYRGRRDSDIYDVQQVKDDLTMDAFYRRQPRAWLESSSLGVARTKLFLDGGFELSDFTTSIGTQINLKELEAMGNNDAKFRKAGVKVS